MATFTAKNLDSCVGEKITVSNGEFSVTPWAYKMPTTSSRFGLSNVPDGVYTITEKVADSSNEGSAVTYTLES